jgi:hypothetical protein
MLAQPYPTLTRSQRPLSLCTPGATPGRQDGRRALEGSPMPPYPVRSFSSSKKGKRSRGLSHRPAVALTVAFAQLECRLRWLVEVRDLEGLGELAEDDLLGPDPIGQLQAGVVHGHRCSRGWALVGG